MLKEIDVVELRRRLDAGESVTLLDVRSDEEREAVHLPSSLHIPLDELEERIDELDDYRDQEIIIYCRSGNRSGQACMFLELLGFSQPVNLRGGLLNWD